MKSVKYLYKYVCKGNNKIAFNIMDMSGTRTVDEISDYQTSRWLCAPEAMWRIYGFDMFDMYPPALQLHVHLPGYQEIYFKANQPLPTVVESEHALRTQLTEFFEMNKKNEVAAFNLLYREFPEHFVWSTKHNRWTARKQMTSIGRLVSVNIAKGDRFYLRLLLNHVRAPTSFDDLKTSNGVLFPTFREAGLLDSDNDVRSALEEAIGYQMPFVLRALFATILAYNAPSDPRKLWEEFKESLSADFIYSNPNELQECFHRSFQSIDVVLRDMGHGVDEYSLVDARVGLTREQMNNREFLSEINVPVEGTDLLSVNHLNQQHRFAFDEIMASVSATTGSGYFIDGPRHIYIKHCWQQFGQMEASHLLLHRLE